MEEDSFQNFFLFTETFFEKTFHQLLNVEIEFVC